MVFGDGFVMEVDIFFGIEDGIFLDEGFDIVSIVIDLVKSDFVDDFGIVFFGNVMLVFVNLIVRGF